MNRTNKYEVNHSGEIRMEKFVNSCKYWFSLVTALYYGGTIVCLSLFHDESASGLPRNRRQLYKALTRQKGFLHSLMKHGVLSLEEWDSIFTKEEETNSENFDLGLLMALLQALILPEPKNGWMDPDPSDISYSAFLVKLRFLKDKLTMMKDPHDMSSSDFRYYWDELCEVLNALGFDVTKIYHLYRATKHETFHISSHHAYKFQHSLDTSKKIYIHKTLADLKSFYARHLSNVCTVLSVVKHSKIEKIEEECLKQKKPLAELENSLDHLRYSDYKHAQKFLTQCIKVHQAVKTNEDALDILIAKYNENVEKEEEKLRKRGNDDEDMKMRKRSNTFTIKKAAVVGWLRRNTLRSMNPRRRTSLHQTSAHHEEQTVVDLGNY